MITFLCFGIMQISMHAVTNDWLVFPAGIHIIFDRYTMLATQMTDNIVSTYDYFYMFRNYVY